MSRKALTANDLITGDVVFLDADDQWIRDVARAQTANDEDEARKLEAVGAAHVQSNRVVEPYLIDVDVTAGSLRPTRNRELIRAMGPTVLPEDRR